MQKINVYSLEGKKKESIELPKIFEINPRIDLINKASEIYQSKRKQKQGRDLRAGLRNTAEGWGTGHGMSRAPRIKGSGFPTARNVGRVPFAVGGRRAHPIKVNKRIKKKINKKAKKFSLISALSASNKKYWIERRGHLIQNIPQIPIIIDDKIQTIKKTKKVYSTFCKFGLEEELSKVKNSKKIRSGKGKRRGRKYKNKKGILLIIKENFGIMRAARNIPGVDVVKIEKLSIEDLAPGGHPGRLIVWTQSAFKELNKFEEEL